MPPFAEARSSPVPATLLARPHWYACRTRARSEKRVRDELERRGLEAYLPLVETERAWSDRTKTVQQALFPGYVFVRFDLTHILEALRVPNLVEVASPNGYPTPVRQAALDAVRRMVDGSNRTREAPRGVAYRRLRAGQEVVVTRGPFEGMRGVLLRDEGGEGRRREAPSDRRRRRIAVRIEALRQATSVLVPRRMCRAVDAAPAAAAAGGVPGDR
jgi:transcription termination/antitermination protein NusG